MFYSSRQFEHIWSPIFSFFFCFVVEHSLQCYQLLNCASSVSVFWPGAIRFRFSLVKASEMTWRRSEEDRCLKKPALTFVRSQRVEKNPCLFWREQWPSTVIELPASLQPFKLHFYNEKLMLGDSSRIHKYLRFSLEDGESSGERLLVFGFLL